MLSARHERPCRPDHRDDALSGRGRALRGEDDACGMTSRKPGRGIDSQVPHQVVGQLLLVAISFRHQRRLTWSRAPGEEFVHGHHIGDLPVVGDRQTEAAHRGSTHVEYDRDASTSSSKRMRRAANVAAANGCPPRASRRGGGPSPRDFTTRGAEDLGGDPRPARRSRRATGPVSSVSASGPARATPSGGGRPSSRNASPGKGPDRYRTRPSGRNLTQLRRRRQWNLAVDGHRTPPVSTLPRANDPPVPVLLSPGKASRVGYAPPTRALLVEAWWPRLYWTSK